MKRDAGVIDPDDDSEDVAYDKWRQEQVDAADALRAHEEAMKRQQPPVPQPCHACTTKYAGCACPICKAERPAYTALKAMSQPKALPDPLPPCSYYPQSLCGCGLRGTCLEAT